MEEGRLLRTGVELETELCCSSPSFKDVTNGSSKSEPTKLDGQHRSSYRGEDSSRYLHARGRNGFLLNHGNDSGFLQRKSVKVSKTGNLPSRRPLITQLEDSVGLAEVDGIRDIPDKPGLYLTRCNSADKTQLAKQKTKFTSKRGDKRNHKLPVRTKNDSFSVKAGLASFSSAAGGNNFFGEHGLKSDNHDVTKHVDDLPLNELLDGTYKHLSFGKDKGKKPADVNDSFLHSIRKACSILQLPRSVQPQHNAEVDSHSAMKMSSLPLSTTAVVANGDNGESSITDLSSSNKVHDSCSKPDSPANPLDMPLRQPIYILERLDLPPHKDLESLLLDATKPGLFLKSTDPCSGKQMSRRASLPPFLWSNTSSWHCRSSSDAGKLSTIRSTCQGRWLRIERNTVTSLGIATNDFTDLKSMTYDQSLVPSSRSKMAPLSDVISPTISVVPQCELDSLASATCLKESYAALDLGGKVNQSGNNNGHCSNILAAAQTLCGMSTNPFIRNPDGILRWQKNPSQKAMKARKFKSVEKPDDVYASSVAVSGSDNLPRRSIDLMLMLPPKKPKLGSSDDRKDYNNFSSVRKESIRWSTPISSRSLPSKSGKESIGSIRHSTSDVAKHSYMMPPPSRILEKAPYKRGKSRKLLTMEWNRRRDRPD